jgi:DHA1 family multidrug resistance protein-like MFS transporter
MLKDIPRRFYYVCAFFVLYGLGRSLLTPFFPKFIEGIVGNLSYLGFIFASPSIMSALSDIPFGDLTDFTGRKRLMMLAVSLIIATVLSYIFVTETWQVVVVQIFVGLGGAMLWVPGRAMTKDLLKKRVATEEMALFAVLANMTIFGASLGGYIAEKYGYTLNFLLSAAIAAISLIFLKKKIIESRKRKKRFLHASKDVVFSLKTYVKDMNWFLHQGNGVRAIFIVSAVLYSWYGASAAFIPLFLFQKFNTDLFTVGIVMTLINLPFMSIEYFFGRLSDRIGEWKMFGTGLLISGIFACLIFFSSSLIIFIFLNILASVGNTILEPLVESMTGKHVSAARRGRLSAIINTGKDLGAVIGVIFAGFLAQAAGISSVFLFGGISFLICYCLVLLIRKFR